jgi:hypothetical protein
MYCTVLELRSIRMLAGVDGFEEVRASLALIESQGFSKICQ